MRYTPAATLRLLHDSPAGALLFFFSARQRKEKNGGGIIYYIAYFTFAMNE